MSQELLTETVAENEFIKWRKGTRDLNLVQCQYLLVSHKWLANLVK